MTSTTPKANFKNDSKATAFVLKDQRFTGSYGNVVFRSLLFGFRPYLALLGVLVMVGTLGRACFLASAWIAGVWADTLAAPTPAQGPSQTSVLQSLFGSWQSQSATVYLVAMGSFALLGFALTALYRVPITRIGALSASRFYDAITHRTSNLPQSFFDRTPVGRIVSRFSSDYGAILRMAGGPFGEFVALIIDLILVSLALAAVNMAFLPVVLLNIGANALVYVSQRNPLRDTRRELSRTRGPCLAHFAEVSQGHATVRLFDKVTSFRRRFLNLVDRHLATKIESTWVLGRFAFALVCVTSASLVLTAWIGLRWSQSGSLSLGQLAVAFTYVTMLSVTTQQFFDYLGRFDEALTGVERLAEYMALSPEPGANGQSQPGAVAIPRDVDSPAAKQENLQPHDASIRIVDLCLRYGPNEPLVLGGDGGPLNLTVASGERLGIIGRTGSGKSSIINAIFYLYPFERGFVSACGRIPAHALAWTDPAQVSGTGQRVLICPLADYRRQLALIAQEPVLMRGTLADNLEVPGRVICTQEMAAALSAVGLGDWLVSLSPHGSLHSRLAFAIAEGGVNLSAGQRQLVCMARALLEDAPILVMDEATSAVDPRSEEQLMKAAADLLGHKTQIRVAHRLSTLEDCHRILWLENGRMKMIDRTDAVLTAFTRRSVRVG